MQGRGHINLYVLNNVALFVMISSTPSQSFSFPGILYANTVTINNKSLDDHITDACIAVTASTTTTPTTTTTTTTNTDTYHRVGITYMTQASPLAPDGTTYNIPTTHPIVILNHDNSNQSRTHALHSPAIAQPGSTMCFINPSTISQFVTIPANAMISNHKERTVNGGTVAYATITDGGRWLFGREQ